MDVERAIKQIANCVHDGLCNGCEYKPHTACRHIMLADALAIIKQQQKQIETMQAVNGQPGEIVHCRDCKWYDPFPMCGLLGTSDIREDFFCADFERG